MSIVFELVSFPIINLYSILPIAAKSLRLCPTLCDPMDCSLTGSSIQGIFQARVLEWGAIAFSALFSLPTSNPSLPPCVSRPQLLPSPSTSLQLTFILLIQPFRPALSSYMPGLRQVCPKPLSLSPSLIQHLAA